MYSINGGISRWVGHIIGSCTESQPESLVLLSQQIVLVTAECEFPRLENNKGNEYTPAGEEKDELEFPKRKN